MAEEGAAFSFTVPQCEPGSTLKVKAVDGVMLQIPIPGNVQPGDELYMGKQNGSWTIVKCTRSVPVAGAAEQQAAPLAAAAADWRPAERMTAECVGSGLNVVLDTTKGPIVISVVPEWAPLGAARFLELVDDGYFKDIAIYRGIQHGLLQFGIVQDGDPRSSQYEPLADDHLVGIPYAEGVVGFAAAGPGTRKSTLCIMKADFRTQLGKGPLGTPSTETPFGMVHPSSMGVMHSITCLGDIPQLGGKGPDPGRLQAEGNSYVLRDFPTCDFVRSARRV